jgi:hypothetical protein
MKFAPKPENDFADYIRTYYRECRYRFDRIEGIAGKWMFRDLVPGLSDFDTRFILNDQMTVDDWCAMSSAIGEAHLALCQRYPAWARNLEHLPGVNLTWAELTSERSYYPEFQQWTYYQAEHPDKISAALEQLGRRPWDIKDEYFHLKRFCLYYGRYDRAIDPPINLSVQVSKYPLHSRLMHYFSPPVLSAVCLLEKRNFGGKLDAFESAAQLLPDLRCWEMVSEILHAKYETPRWYSEPNVTELEDALEEALHALAQAVWDSLTLVPPRAGLDIAAWKRAVQQAPIDPALVIFDNAKFARLMKGRLWFYVHAPNGFATAWLIQNELRRIGHSFFRAPFQTFWQIRTGERVENPVAILDQLRGDLLTPAEVEATREFDHLTSAPVRPGEEQGVAAAIVAVFDDFFRALYKISQAV